MRDAPDARVVLEVALVRLARAELDDSAAALADRLSRLERGAPPAGRPAAPAPATPAPGPTPAPSAPAAAPGPAPDPGSRPALGALRRQRQAAAPVERPPVAEVPASGADEPGPAEAAPAEPAATPPPAPPARTAPAGQVPDRDALQLAWGDHILRGLPARAKALYSAGRFLAVDDGVASFALPNAAHRDRCQEVKGVVDRALAEYFGVRVPLTLVVDEDGGGPPRAATPSTADAVPAAGVEDLGDDDFDPDDATDAVGVESVAEARLLEAFPGAHEVPE
jgi:hypothetical protein